MGDLVTNVKDLNKKLLDRLQKFLSREEAAQISIWLLEALFRKNRVDLVVNSPLIISKEDQEKIEGILIRLERQEPIQYILAQAPFYGRMFLVNPSVLIPRPETEELVQLIVQQQGNKKDIRLLDIGTGSGCIAISLALELKEAQVHALDISPEALVVARQNAQELQAGVNFLEADILNATPELPSLDIVVSNPPYVRHQEALLMKDNVLSYEPHLALFVDDNDPLVFYRRIAFLATQLLKKEGLLYFEINEAFAAETVALLKQFGFQSVRVFQDMQGKNRMVSAVWPI